MKTAIVLLGLLPVVPALTFAFAPAPFPRRVKIRRVEVGKNVTLEIEGDRAQRRRVIVAASVCLRKGDLEHLLTRKTRKEHEAILTADVDARHVHTALLLAGAIPGAPALVDPKYAPARGQVIRISLEWQEKGKKRRAAAGQWLRDRKTKKAMTADWVFAGSQFIPDPNGPGKQRYLANEGDMICVANFETAMLDVPYQSSKASASLTYEAFTENIPPLHTPVNLILAPVARK